MLRRADAEVAGQLLAASNAEEDGSGCLEQFQANVELPLAVEDLQLM